MKKKKRHREVNLFNCIICAVEPRFKFKEVTPEPIMLETTLDQLYEGQPTILGQRKNTLCISILHISHKMVSYHITAFSYFPQTITTSSQLGEKKVFRKSVLCLVIMIRSQGLVNESSVILKQ